MHRSGDALVEALSERIGCSAASAALAVRSLDRSPVALGRFASFVRNHPAWPSEPSKGDVAFEVLVALRAASADVEPTKCIACGEERAIRYIVPAGASCQACGPQGTVMCPAGRHEMPPTSSRCKVCVDLEAIENLVRAAEICGAASEVAAEVVASSLPSMQIRSRAAAWLSAGGTIDGDDAGPRSIQTLRSRLAELGLVEPSVCSGCRKPGDLRYPFEGGRLCTRCYMSAGAEPCSSCGRDLRVCWRDSKGRPWCETCRRRHPDRVVPCSTCGAIGPVAFHAPSGPIGLCCYKTPSERCRGCLDVRPVWARRREGSFCRSCFDQPLAPCARCGETRRVPVRAVRGRTGWCVPCCRLPLVPGDEGALRRGGPCSGCERPIKIQAHLPDGPRCSGCYDKALERRQLCSQCGDLRRVYFDDGICAGCLKIDAGQTCVTCGIEARIYAAGHCVRCELNTRVDRLLDSFEADTAALATVLKSARSPKAALRWLSTSASCRQIEDVLRSGAHVTHEQLDDLPRVPDRRGHADSRHDVEYTRALLIAAGMLPARSGVASQFEPWAAEWVSDLSAGDRWVLMRFCRERLIPTLEWHDEIGKSTSGSLRWAKARLRASSQLLEWLQPRGGLGALNRERLDEWLTGPTTRFIVRDFVLWASRTDQTSIGRKETPRRQPVTASESAGHDELQRAARHLLHEPGRLTDRVGGLLVVLYGQHLSRIVRLSLEQVRSEPTRLALGGDWLVIPEPMDVLVEELVTAARRSGPASPQWLFPGQRPGTHLSEDALGARLERVGVSARSMRNAAVFHLASQIQPHTLYRLLGLHPNTAAKWAQVAGSIYANYWAELVEEDEFTLDADELEEPAADEDVLSELGVTTEANDFS